MQRTFYFAFEVADFLEMGCGEVGTVSPLSHARSRGDVPRSFTFGRYKHLQTLCSKASNRLVDATHWTKTHEIYTSEVILGLYTWWSHRHGKYTFKEQNDSHH